MNKKAKYRKRRSIVHIIGIKVFNLLFRCRKIKNNKVFLVNFSNRYECNPKYICEELLKEGNSFDIVFATNKKSINKEKFPNNIRVVAKGTSSFYKELYSSRIIIDNDVTLAFLGFRKKKGQIMFQTWHGSLGIKAFGKDANNDALWHKMAEKSAKKTDFVISNSEFENRIYKETFWGDNLLLKYGHPRNDIFFKEQKIIDDIKKKICERYSLNPNNKLCLYAPTFRDNNEISAYLTDYDELKKSLENKFGGEWTILVRLHTVTNEKGINKEAFSQAVDVSDYPDIQELAAIIDCGITDYSSWICEYLLRKKAGFIYAPDADEYKNNERKLTIQLEDLPFPLAKNMNDLVSNISSFDKMIYVDKCEKFLKLHGSIDDGTASKKVVDKIKELVKLG